MSHLSERPANPIVGQEIPHESATLHVTGSALYTDDLVGRTPGALHAHPVQSDCAHARIVSIDTAPALQVSGVVRVLTAADVPGVNDAGVKHDEPLFPEDEVMFYGHAVCWVLGETLEGGGTGLHGERIGAIGPAQGIHDRPLWGAEGVAQGAMVPRFHPGTQAGE